MAEPRIQNKRKLVDVRGFVNKNRSAIYGMLLGDATIPAAHGRNTLLQVSHSEKQRDYVFYKYGLLSSISYPPTHGDYSSGKVWKFHTVRDVEWQRVWSVFHEGSAVRDRAGKKYIPKVVNRKILDALDDLGVALWWMDDGHTSFWWNNETLQWREYASLAICDVTFQEADLIAAWFREKYGADGKVQKVKSQKFDHHYPLLYMRLSPAAV